jgi:hypothetical protein
LTGSVPAQKAGAETAPTVGIATETRFSLVQSAGDSGGHADRRLDPPSERLGIASGVEETTLTYFGTNLPPSIGRPDARVLQVGEYGDVFVREGAVPKLKERRSIYDNLLIPTALCIPV